MVELVAECATATDIGRRARQEDALLADFPQGGALGLAVLSDGMGGHEDGDLASRIIVSEMFSELFCGAEAMQNLSELPGEAFRNALASVNDRLRVKSEAGSINENTGGTVVSVTIRDGDLFWLSVGDSPLYLMRDGVLTRINADHSMAPEIDLLVENGIMTPEVGRTHPQRNCLTSAVTGQDIPKIDCPDMGVPLAPGDMVLLASDGLNVLPDEAIEALIARARRKGCQEVASCLMQAVAALEVPDQDNVSLVVIEVKDASVPARASRSIMSHLIASGRSGLARRARGMLGPISGRNGG